jgi:hypothetical protein
MRKVLQQILFISAVTIIVISCEKGEEPFPTSINTEKTLVQLPDAANGPIAIIALELTPGAQTVNVLRLQRNASTPAELHKPLTVKIKLQNAVISDPTSGELHELPRNLYTSHPDNPFDGQYWTVTFPADEPITYLKIILDASTLISLGQRVGLGFQLAETPGAQISDSKNQLGVELGAKNKYDGIYEITGAALREGDPLLTGSFGPYERALVTTGANSVQWVGQVLWANGSNSALPAGYEPQVTVDPVTNLITSLRSPNGLIMMTNPVVRTDILNGTQQRYDPASKTLYFEFTYTTPTNRLFSFSAKYLRPR